MVSASGKQTKTQELASGSCNLSPERAASSPQISQFASVLHSPGINTISPHVALAGKANEKNSGRRLAR